MLSSLLNPPAFEHWDRGCAIGAQFNFATGEQTDAGFGRVTGVRANSNRVIQLGARITF
jgi:hypothetical protein